MKKKLKKSRKNNDFIEIYGFHAVNAALKNTYRTHKKLIIYQNFLDKFKYLRNKVEEIISIPNREFIKLYGNEKNHQGIILITSKIKQPAIEDIINNLKKKEIDVVVMLDHVTDPQNIGSIIRSCALFNCSSVIVSKNHSPEITSSMLKAASGALEIVNYIKVTNLSRIIEKFKQHNYWVTGFDNNKNISSKNIDLAKKSLLIFGSEDKGLRELTKKECDQIIKIPVKTNKQFRIDSLNINNACTLALYEHYKKNNIKN